MQSLSENTVRIGASMLALAELFEGPAWQCRILANGEDPQLVGRSLLFEW